MIRRLSEKLDTLLETALHYKMNKVTLKNFKYKQSPETRTTYHNGVNTVQIDKKGMWQHTDKEGKSKTGYGYVSLHDHLKRVHG